MVAFEANLAVTDSSTSTAPSTSSWLNSLHDWAKNDEPSTEAVLQGVPAGLVHLYNRNDDEFLNGTDGSNHGAWPGTSIWDTSCCCQPPAITGFP